MAFRNSLLRQFDRAEVSFAVRRETTIYQQPRSAVLEVITFILQVGDAFVGRAHVLDLIADVLGIGPGEDSASPFRIQLARDQNGNLPFIFRFRNAGAGNLWAEDYATFRTGLASATALLVAGTRRKKHNRVCRIDQHGGIHDDVLM